MPNIDEMVSSFRPVHSVALRLRDVPITVKTDSQEVAESLADYFEPYLSFESPDMRPHEVLICACSMPAEHGLMTDLPRRNGKPPKESFYDTPDGRVLVKKRTGLAIYSVGAAKWVFGDAVTHFNQVVNAVEQVYMEDHIDRGYLLFHAAAVARSDNGVLIAAESGLGKSSAALATLDLGLKYMSNDRVLLGILPDRAVLVGIPKKPRINPGTALALPSLHALLSNDERARYASMDREELWRLERKMDVDVEALYGRDTTMLEATLRLAVFLAWSPDGSTPVFTRLQDSEAAMLLGRHLLTGAPYRPNPGPQREQADLTHVARWTECYRVDGGVDLKSLARFVSEHAAG